MTEAENHQLELERQQLIDNLAEEAHFHLLTSYTLGVHSVSDIVNGSFTVTAHDRTFRVTVEET